MEYDSVILVKRVRKQKEKRSGEKGSDIGSPLKRSRKEKGTMKSSNNDGNIRKMLKETQNDLLKECLSDRKNFQVSANT